MGMVDLRYGRTEMNESVFLSVCLALSLPICLPVCLRPVCFFSLGVESSLAGQFVLLYTHASQNIFFWWPSQQYGSWLFLIGVMSFCFCKDSIL